MPPGRPQKYDWDDKRDICYKLYVEEKRSVPQIVKYFSEHFSIPVSELPNQTLFNRRFKQWGFPPRINKLTPKDEEQVIVRVKELYNQNLPSKRIQETLAEEGFEIDNYHFNKLRRKHGLIMRGDVAFKARPPREKKRKAASDDTAEADRGGVPPMIGAVESGDVNGHSEPSSLPPEEAARRAQLLADLQVQSDQALQTRKRRRRVRGYGHMGPDAPGTGPRYSSETSLDECKAYLQLTNELYNQLRAEFEAICREQGVKKMSECADGVWQAIKDRLVRENAHLSAVLHPLQPDLERKNVGLQCICVDVTKRVRTIDKYLTVADANNILQLDPIQSKDLRRQFYDILAADHFTTTVQCGKEHLEELRQKWYAQSEVLQAVVQENDPKKLHAVFLLDRDTRKRFGDDRGKKDPSSRLWQKATHYGPGPGPAGSTNMPDRRGKGPTAATVEGASNATATKATHINARNATEGYDVASKRLIASVGPSWIGREVPIFRSTTIADLVPPINFDLDPALEQLDRPRTGPMWPPSSSPNQQEREADPATISHGQYIDAPSSMPSPPLSIPAYFRLSPQSTLVGSHPRMWLGKLSSRSVAALHAAAASKAGATRVAKVHGVVKNGDGNEDSWLIESDDELEVYLGEAGEKATFVVVLEGGYA